MIKAGLKARIVPTLVLPGIVLVASLASAEDTLAWTFSPGQSLKLEVVDDIKTVAIQAGQSFEIPQQRTLEADWRVAAVSPEGQATIELTLTRLRLNSRAPFTGEIDFDSQGIDPGAPERVQAVQALFAKVVGLKLSFQMTGQGVVSGMAWSAALPDDVEDQPLISELLKLTELETAVASGGRLPNQALEPGAAWEYEIRRDTPAGTLLFTNSVALDGRDEEDNSKIKLATQTEVSLNPVDNNTADNSAQAVYRIKESQIAGEAIYDSRQGWISSAKSQQRFTLVVEKDGVTAEQKVSRNTQFSLTAAEPGQ